ncbi:MAG: cytochrome c3 family protein [bacterium]
MLANNPTQGAQTPSNPEMARRIFDNKVVCSTCHNQHDQTFSPFLRASNFQNAMCKDGHAVRNVGSYRTHPDNKGSHPDGIVYPTNDNRFYRAPQNPDILLIHPNRVECTSCHSPHYADSGGANSGAGDGYILRAKNEDDLCQSCHTYQAHQNQGCHKCPSPHDPSRNNLFLVKPTISTPNSGDRSVVFTAESGEHSFADRDSNYDGVCEVCHTATAYHRNNSSGYHPHNPGLNCTAPSWKKPTVAFVMI